jgi:hypothetical protein
MGRNMATYQEALNTVSAASLTLQAAWSKAKNQAQADKIVSALQIVQREYLALLNIDPGRAGDPYKAISDEFRGSKAQIQQIINDRTNLVNGIQLAAQIANALGPLLAFL